MQLPPHGIGLTRISPDKTKLQARRSTGQELKQQPILVPTLPGGQHGQHVSGDVRVITEPDPLSQTISRKKSPFNKLPAGYINDFTNPYYSISIILKLA